MTLSIPATEFNRRLLDLLRNSSSINEFLITSRVVFWRLVGLGTLAFGLGAAVGFAFWGYAHIVRNSINVTAVSKILAKGLEEARLAGVAEGTLQIDPHEISLAKGQTISLDRLQLFLLIQNLR
jgi:hypothetical protein